MRILVCNDDGIYSPGIAALADVALEFGSVRIVAPDVEQSSMGHAVTHSRPLSYRPTSIGNLTAFRVNGTPADCVALGAHHWERIDVVLSGCNMGLNLGNSIWHSGTLAAAKQAALLGMRGVALSAPAGRGDPDFEALKPWIRRALEVVFACEPVPLVNINFPREPRGMIWTRASVRQYDGRIEPTRHPLGRELYWFTVRPLEDAEEGTDRWAVEQGWVSLTPLRLDLTDDTCLRKLRRRMPLDEERAFEASTPTSPDVTRLVQEDEAQTSIDAGAEPDPAGRAGGS